MSRNLRAVTWNEFDVAVETIARRVDGLRFAGIYGPPRGGLVLGVALSHRLSLPLLPAPAAGMLWVDDIVDSGLTMMQTAQGAKKCCCFLSRREEPELISVEVLNNDDWIVFPWESLAHAVADARGYHATRQ